MFLLTDVIFRDILDIPALQLEAQITCIVGASGSGKTTLLRLLNRLSRPESGAILLDGWDISALDPVALRRRVVMLGQAPILYPGDIRDNLLIGLELSGRQAVGDDALKAAMERVGLAKGLSEGCSTLSGGERQRLCLARVMLMDAECYLLDEPSSALDRDTERAVIEQLASFTTERGRQLIMVTHSDTVAASYPQGLVRLERGRVKGAGV